MTQQLKPLKDILIIHPEATFYAGAEKVLEYYLDGLVQAACSATIALVAGSELATRIPKAIRKLAIPNVPQLSLTGLLQQAAVLTKAHHERPFRLIHAWAARDWELAAAMRWRLRIPAIGTLHDHPHARFIRRRRRWLMYGCARWGLDRIITVSDAVRRACIEAGYREQKMETIHNGLPELGDSACERKPHIMRLGFLGAFSERKGLTGLFAILDELARYPSVAWDCWIAGAAQNEEGHRLMDGLRQRYARKEWWPRIRWLGWITKPLEFLASLDCLLFTSTEFDPFPTVLLEAGLSGTPVLASRVGGVEEIIQNEVSGWLFAAGDWPGAAQLLNRLAANPERLKLAGVTARQRVKEVFTVAQMTANYLHVYTALAP